MSSRKRTRRTRAADRGRGLSAQRERRAIATRTRREGPPCGSPPMKSQPVSGILYRLPGGDHPSATAVTDGLMQPTREHRTGRPLPAWPCSARGLPSHDGHPSCWWALTPPFHPCPLPDAAWRLARPCPDRWRYRFCGAFPGSPQVGVTHRAALWSPDFPRHALRRAAIARPTQPLQPSASVPRWIARERGCALPRGLLGLPTRERRRREGRSADVRQRNWEREDERRS